MLGSDNDIISKQKEIIEDLRRRVKTLQDEISLVASQKKSKPENKPSHSVSKIPRSGSVMKSKAKSSLNMSLGEEDAMPQLERVSSTYSKDAKNQDAAVMKFIKSSKNKLFTLDSEEDKQIMNQIDTLEPEQLRINLLQTVKANKKLENNLEAVKKEMSSKISLLRRDLGGSKTMKENTNERPDSTFSRQSKDSVQINNHSNLDDKIKELTKDNEDAYQRISVLQNELNNQEEFFRNKIKKMTDYNSKMHEDTILNESKFVNMMGKLSEEQNKFYADKKATEEKVKETLGSANKKVIFCFHSNF